jgi:hypothetical protein
MNEHDLAEHGTELAAGCPKIAAGKVMDLCGVIYPDRIPPETTAYKAAEK